MVTWIVGALPKRGKNGAALGAGVIEGLLAQLSQRLAHSIFGLRYRLYVGCLVTSQKTTPDLAPQTLHTLPPWKPQGAPSQRFTRVAVGVPHPGPIPLPFARCREASRGADRRANGVTNEGSDVVDSYCVQRTRGPALSRHERQERAPHRCLSPASRPLAGLPSYRGRVVLPIKLSSIERAHWRPSRIAQTTSDWPRRMSPAANSRGTLVL